MRTKFFTLCLSLFAAYSLQAAEIPVDTETFSSALSSATDGDVLLLSSGTYSKNFAFPNGIAVTLKAAEGATPVFTGAITGTVDINDGSLIFDGVTIDRSEQYVISTALGNYKLLAFRNLTIQNVNRCVLRTTNTEDGKVIDKVEFDNCIIKDCGMNGYNLMYPGHLVKSVSVKNSTLYNYTGGESLFFPNHRGAVDGTTNDFEFIFENNTVYKWGKDSTRALANVASIVEGVPTANKYSANSTYTFRNNIVTVSGVAGEEPKMIYVFEGTVIAENNLVVDYGGYVGGTQTINDKTLVDLGLATIGFLDPDNGDFTITKSSPITTAKIGDPRWLDIETGINPIQKTDKEIQSVTYYNVLGKALTKANATGLVIVKTVYTDGSVSAQKQLISTP